MFPIISAALAALALIALTLLVAFVISPLWAAVILMSGLALGSAAMFAIAAATR